MDFRILFLFTLLGSSCLHAQNHLSKAEAMEWVQAGVTTKSNYRIELSRRGKDRDTVLVEYVELLHASEDSLVYVVHQPAVFEVCDSTVHKILWDDQGEEILRLQIEQHHFRKLDFERSNARRTVWQKGWCVSHSEISGERNHRDSLGRVVYSERLYGQLDAPMREIAHSSLDQYKGIFFIPESKWLYGAYGIDTTYRYAEDAWQLQSSYRYGKEGKLVRRADYLMGREDHVTTYAYDEEDRLILRTDSMLIPHEEIPWANGERLFGFVCQKDLYVRGLTSSGLAATETRHWLAEDSVEIVIDIHSEHWYDPTDLADLHYVRFINREGHVERKWFNYFGRADGPQPPIPGKASSESAIFPGRVVNTGLPNDERRRYIAVYR